VAGVKGTHGRNEPDLITGFEPVKRLLLHASR
jgi:hypothetical protein